MFCSKSPFTFHEFSGFLPSVAYFSMNSAVSCHLFYFVLFLYLHFFYFFVILIFRLPTACSCFLEPVHGYLGRVRRSEERDFESQLGFSNDQSLNQENIFYHQDYVEGSQRRAQVEDKDISSSNSFFNVSLASFVQPISRSNANS